ncbi:unnamed protein product [Fraxinus pennsylvanica]|uniref:Uncharacterized protein n=1 Tax=Fraxinus pennsylvanica TaxID=56036 RepID=A0AAD2E3K9_9LAMI|nr:unnamed protein product [Fraxinus pennsylvanica]
MGVRVIGGGCYKIEESFAGPSGGRDDEEREKEERENRVRTVAGEAAETVAGEAAGVIAGTVVGIVAEEPDKNYFSLRWLIPKIINALWELIRSFIIPYIGGADYEEGGFLQLLRVIGLLTAGLPAHCPQDYVNATRLGPLDVYLN